MEEPSGILRYGRDSLLKLQEADAGNRQARWAKILTELPEDVAEELRDMHVEADEPPRFRQRSKYSERKARNKAKREALHALSINSLGGGGQEDDESCLQGSLEPTSWHKTSENNVRFGQNKRAYHTEEAPEVESFQPQAFMVEGEPDFESGDPQDGWEYLRRVKYEAARCPKVVVAEIDSMKLVSEQTPYMPEIPDILACPPDLLPSSEWEGQLLDDFSSLRTALLATRVPRKSTSDRLPSLRNQAAWEMRCFGCNISEKQGILTEIDASMLESSGGSRADDSQQTLAVTESSNALYSAESDNVMRSTEVDCIMAPAESDELASVAQAQSELSFEAGGSTKDELNPEGDQDPVLSFVEVAKRQLDQLLAAEAAADNGPAEVNYVIDLEMLRAALPGFYEPDDSFNAYEYLISGEPTDTFDIVDYEMNMSSSCISTHDEAVNNAGSNVHSDSLNVYDLLIGVTAHDELSIDDVDLLMLQHLTINKHEEHHDADDDEHILDPGSSAFDLLAPRRDTETMSDVTSSNSTSALFPQHAAPDSSDLKVPAENSLEQGSNDVHAEPNGVDRVISFDRISDVELTEQQGLTPEQHEGSADHGQPLDHFTFEDSYVDLSTQLEYLSLGSNTGHYSQALPSELDVTLESLCGFGSAEYEEALIPDNDFLESVVGLEVFNSGKAAADDSFHDGDESDDFCTFELERSVEELFVKVFHLSGISRLPFVRLLLRLDEISRATLLRYHASWLGVVGGLPLDRALWLLALSAVVDTPLDAQTSAAFRSLLRHCARIRAEEHSIAEEDLHILNALITVAGLYFGQAEKQLTRDETVDDTNSDQSWAASQVLSCV